MSAIINESMKSWTKNLTQEQYDLRVLTAPEFMEKYKVSFSTYELMLKEHNGN
jgi:hypothetical protein